MHDLVDLHFPQAERCIVVEDHLNTHAPAALCQLPPGEPGGLSLALHKEIIHDVHPRRLAD